MWFKRNHNAGYLESTFIYTKKCPQANAHINIHIYVYHAEACFFSLTMPSGTYSLIFSHFYLVHSPKNIILSHTLFSPLFLSGGQHQQQQQHGDFSRQPRSISMPEGQMQQQQYGMNMHQVQGYNNSQAHGGGGGRSLMGPPPGMQDPRANSNLTFQEQMAQMQQQLWQQHNNGGGGGSGGHNNQQYNQQQQSRDYGHHHHRGRDRERDDRDRRDGRSLSGGGGGGYQGNHGHRRDRDRSYSRGRR